jgi:hypothetical protein
MHLDNILPPEDLSTSKDNSFNELDMFKQHIGTVCCNMILLHLFHYTSNDLISLLKMYLILSYQTLLLYLIMLWAKQRGCLLNGLSILNLSCIQRIRLRLMQHNFWLRMNCNCERQFGICSSYYLKYLHSANLWSTKIKDHFFRFSNIFGELYSTLMPWYS